MKQEPDLSIPSGNPRLAADDGVFDLPGAEPAWRWAHNCANATCDCRSALEIATDVGRDFLLERGQAVLEALTARGESPDPGAAIDDLIVFNMDIDFGDCSSSGTRTTAQGSRAAIRSSRISAPASSDLHRRCHPRSVATTLALVAPAGNTRSAAEQAERPEAVFVSGPNRFRARPLT